MDMTPALGTEDLPMAELSGESSSPSYAAVVAQPKRKADDQSVGSSAKRARPKTGQASAQPVPVPVGPLSPFGSVYGIAGYWRKYEASLQQWGITNCWEDLERMANLRWRIGWKSLVIEAKELAAIHGFGRLGPHQRAVLELNREAMTSLEIVMDNPKGAPEGLRWVDGYPVPEDLKAWDLYCQVVNKIPDIGRRADIKKLFMETVQDTTT